MLKNNTFTIVVYNLLYYKKRYLGFVLHTVYFENFNQCKKTCTTLSIFLFYYKCHLVFALNCTKSKL